MVTKTLKPFELDELYWRLTQLHEELDADESRRYRDSILDVKNLIKKRLFTQVQPEPLF